MIYIYALICNFQSTNIYLWLACRAGISSTTSQMEKWPLHHLRAMTWLPGCGAHAQVCRCLELSGDGECHCRSLLRQQGTRWPQEARPDPR